MPKQTSLSASSRWLGKLATLNAARTERRGLAPYKPLLLFCVLDMIEGGLIKDGWVNYGADLVFRFQNYWPIVLDRQQNRPEITMPFHALGSARDGIWNRFTEDGDPSQAKQTTRRCLLHPDFWLLLHEENFRAEARRILIETYFPPTEKVSLYSLMGIKEPNTEELALLRQNADLYIASQKKGRDARFKTEVCSRYKYTCALTGYRCTTETANIVEAAHIHQHAASGNDDPRNGLALSPNAHWMFDQGLWTVDCTGDRYLIQVARNKFCDAHPTDWSLNKLDGRPLFFPEGVSFRPSPVHFRWHRSHRFLGQPTADLGARDSNQQRSSSSSRKATKSFCRQPLSLQNPAEVPYY
jgi:putative restriction endonuclease